MGQSQMSFIVRCPLFGGNVRTCIWVWGRTKGCNIIIERCVPYLEVMYGYGAEPSTSLLKSVFYQVYSLQRRKSSKSYVTLCNTVGITRCPAHVIAPLRLLESTISLSLLAREWWRWQRSCELSEKTRNRRGTPSPPYTVTISSPPSSPSSLIDYPTPR